ncbi:MAG TPA: helix-turn-helix domain-containing protein [Halococcus sp.]|nr:helix-turn-helix domain-containing protein [Halococcus sp.]
MNDSQTTSTLSPEDAFSLLGNETRIGIIQALWDIGDGASFSELRDRADVADSGQFNYHLGKLVGTFVRRDGDGYELTYAGMRIIGAILDGTFTKRAEIEPFEIGVSCFVCESPLEVSYENEHITVRCPTCDEVSSRFGFPPGALSGRTREELVETSAQWIWAQFSFIVNGICPNCAGVMTHSITTDPEYRDREVGLEYDCERCTDHATSTVGSYLIYHPAVIAFYNDHGIDLSEELWESHIWTSDEYTRVLSDDPWRISVTIPLKGDELEIVLDGDLNTVEQHQK